MDITIIVAIACLIVGGAVGYMIFRYVINGKYKEMVSAAEKEAEKNAAKPLPLPRFDYKPLPKFKGCTNC